MSGAYFTFNGVDPSIYGAYLVSRRLALIPELRERTMPVDSRPGVVDFGTRYAGRELELDIWVQAASRAALETALGNLATLFDPTKEVAGDRGFKPLVFDSLSDRYYLAKLADVPVPELAATSASMTLTMRCADPLAYATSATVTTVASGSASWTDAGTYRSLPAIEITFGATFSGTVVMTTGAGESLSWVGSVVNTDKLTVDSALLRVYKNGTLSMSGLVNGSRFPSSNPGSNNVVTTGGTISQTKITRTHRYL